jgi:hypothetical protein
MRSVGRGDGVSGEEQAKEDMMIMIMIIIIIIIIIVIIIEKTADAVF